MGHILDRGYDYYCEDVVTELHLQQNILKATVCGTEDYAVEITFRGEQIADMNCSCPYAENGEHCKHMAAVLFEWESRDCDEEEAATSGAVLQKTAEEDSVAALVANAEEEDVRKFLTIILENDEKLFVRFKNMINPEVSKEDMKKYKRQVDHTVQRSLGREHFINYYEADNFIREMEEFLISDVQMMLDNGCYQDAFELTNYIFVTAGNVDMDDSGGGKGMLAEHCYEIWLEILEKTEMKIKRSMYEWFANHLDGSIIDYMEEHIEKIMMEEFSEKEFIYAKLDFTNQKVIESEQEQDSWSSDYRAGKWALSHLQLMECTGSGLGELEDYCQEHWKSSKVRTYYIERCISENKYERAIEVLKESLVLDAEYRGLICDYSVRLKELYLKLGKKEEYREQLWNLILKDNAGDVEVFYELKTQYIEEEWPEVREKIFLALPAYAHVERLYREEKLYDRLLQYVQNSVGLYALREYEGVLKIEYPAEILKKYMEEINNMARRTADRKRYKELVSVLRCMQKIAGGKKMVEEIALHWRMAYGNRPAMMDELSKLNK